MLSLTGWRWNKNPKSWCKAQSECTDLAHSTLGFNPWHQKTDETPQDPTHGKSGRAWGRGAWGSIGCWWEQPAGGARLVVEGRRTERVRDGTPKSFLEVDAVLIPQHRICKATS